MTLDIAIDLSSPLWATLPDAEKRAKRAILASAEAAGVRLRDGAEVGLLLVDDERIRALNARWRGLDRPTNVLSFPAVAAEKLGQSLMLGDIVVAFETTRREAEHEGKTLGDHFTHLVVHGFLHLVGFDHEVCDDAERMETLETRILAGMAIADPYAEVLAADERA
jgi:probable rRNA maturation factor